MQKLILILVCMMMTSFVHAQDVLDDATGVDEAVAAEQLRDKKEFTQEDLDKADAEIQKQLQKNSENDECADAESNLKSAQRNGDYQDIIKATNIARGCGIEVKTSGRRGG